MVENVVFSVLNTNEFKRINSLMLNDVHFLNSCTAIDYLIDKSNNDYEEMIKMIDSDPRFIYLIVTKTMEGFNIKFKDKTVPVLSKFLFKTELDFKNFITEYYFSENSKEKSLLEKLINYIESISENFVLTPEKKYYKLAVVFAI